MGKSNKKSSFSSSSKVASLVGTELSANKKKRKMENKADKKKLLESAEKSAPTDKKSKKKRKSTDDDDPASKDISAEDQKVASLVGTELSANKKKRKIENKAEKKKLLESAEKSAPTDKKSKKKCKSTDDDGAPTDKKSKKKRKSTDDDDDDDTASKDISAEDQKAEKPAKKLPESSEKSASTAKKSSSEDSPSEDISANRKGMEIVVDESARLHLYEHFWRENVILPKDSKTLFTRNIACPPGRKITQADFEKFFRKAGKVVNVQIKFFDHNEDFVELAEIEFESHDVAKRALKKRHMYLLFGTSVCLDVSREGSGPLYNMTDCTHERPVLSVVFGKDFISDNLHNKLKDIFKSCGEIKFIIATRDEDTYLSNGYAYVVFKDFESLPKAIDLDGTEFMGAPMKITRARVLVTSV